MSAILQTGAVTINNAQPLVLNYIKGTLALAHNGNLVHTEELREELARTGATFQTTTDSEIIAYEIARARVQTRTVEEAIRLTASKLKGAYGLVIASPRKLIGVRDPLGISHGRTARWMESQSTNPGCVQGLLLRRHILSMQTWSQGFRIQGLPRCRDMQKKRASLLNS